MPILGIDREKCISCGKCISSCPQLCFAFSTDKTSVVFDDNRKWCFDCGHCIAICPQNAILFEKMGDSSPELKTILDMQNKIPQDLTYEKIHALLRSIRSHRNYKSERLSDEILEKIFDTISYAPSGSNLRNWKLTLISDPEEIKNISLNVQETIINMPGIRTKYEAKLTLRKQHGIEDPIFFKAPHVLVLTAAVDMDIEGVNSGIILTYLNVIAKTLGVGTCWIGLAQLALESNQELKKKLKIRGKVYGVLTLGFPKEDFLRLPPRTPIKVRGFKN